MGNFLLHIGNMHSVFMRKEECRNHLVISDMHRLFLLQREIVLTYRLKK